MADATNCVKCGGQTDSGAIANAEGVPFVSDRQQGMIRRPTFTSRAVVCLSCGYTELYVDPQELGRNIG